MMNCTELSKNSDIIDHSVYICCLITEREDLVITVATDDMTVTSNSDQAGT